MHFRDRDSMIYSRSSLTSTLLARRGTRIELSFSVLRQNVTKRYKIETPDKC